MPPAQALPPADAAVLPLHTEPGTLSSRHRTAPRTSPPIANVALRPWLRRPLPSPRALPTRRSGTHDSITHRDDDQSVRSYSYSPALGDHRLQILTPSHLYSTVLQPGALELELEGRRRSAAAAEAAVAAAAMAAARGVGGGAAVGR